MSVIEIKFKDGVVEKHKFKYLEEEPILGFMTVIDDKGKRTARINLDLVESCREVGETNAENNKK